MANKRVVSLLFLFLSVFSFQSFAQLAGPSSYFSESDGEALKNVLLSSQKADGTFVGFKNTYHAVYTLSKLGVSVPKKEKVCEFVSSENPLKETPEFLFYTTSVQEILGCEQSLTDKDMRTLKQALSSSKLDDLHYGISIALARSSIRSSVTDIELVSAAQKILYLGEEDGTFRLNEDDNQGSTLNTGLALQALAKFASSSKEIDSALKARFEKVLQDVFGGVFLLSEDGENTIYWTDVQASSLRTTSTLFQGVSSLASALGKNSGVRAVDLTRIIEFFVQNKNPASIEDAYYSYTGLQAANKNPFQNPIVLSLSSNTLSVSSKGSEGYVKVKITDLFGKAIEGPKVFLEKAFMNNNPKSVIASNQEIYTSEADKSTYQFNYLAAKPEPGFHTLIFRVSADKKFASIDSAQRTLKVIGSAVLSDVELFLTFTQDSEELKEAIRYKVEHPSKLSESLKVSYGQYLNVNFKLKSPTGKTLQTQQSFLRLSNPQTGEESFFVSKYNGKHHTVSINTKQLGRDLLNRNGSYHLELMIGDAFISNSLNWKMADVQLTFPADAAVVAPRSPFTLLPEIKHEFRPADPRPSWVISQAFTIAIIALFAIMVLAVLRIGNLKGFPTGATFLYAVGFHGCFGLILAIYILHWLSLTMVQTVMYLGVLSVPTFIFAQKALAGPSQKSHSD